MARRKGFEPPTFWFVAKHSIQLSYRRIYELLQAADIILSQQSSIVKHFIATLYVSDVLSISLSDLTNQMKICII